MDKNDKDKLNYLERILDEQMDFIKTVKDYRLIIASSVILAIFGIGQHNEEVVVSALGVLLFLLIVMTGSTKSNESATKETEAKIKALKQSIEHKEKVEFLKDLQQEFIELEEEIKFQKRHPILLPGNDEKKKQRIHKSNIQLSKKRLEYLKQKIAELKKELY